MGEPPVGTITLVFTDIEGSTRLAHGATRLPTRARAASQLRQPARSPSSAPRRAQRHRGWASHQCKFSSRTEASGPPVTSGHVYVNDQLTCSPVARTNVDRLVQARRVPAGQGYAAAPDCLR